MGQIEISNTNGYSNGSKGYQISPLLQELMVYAGSQTCYSKCNEVLKKFLDIEMSVTQVYRVTETYGSCIDASEQLERTMPICNKEDTLYVEVDGSMVLTREESWKEVKLGRIFKASDCIRGTTQQAGWIRNSQYIGTLENSQTFTTSVEQLINQYRVNNRQIVFITDGAKWIKNWQEDHFEGVTTILDYYHAVEYLHAFAKEHFADSQERSKWLIVQQKLLLASKVTAVITGIREMAGSKKYAKKILDYYVSNIDRMDYARYKKIGLGIIGSGAIESAHRTVIQERMKLSGQRWSKKGAQHLLNLRILKMNGQWDKVIGMIKNNYTRAA